MLDFNHRKVFFWHFVLGKLIEHFVKMVSVLFKMSYLVVLHVFSRWAYLRPESLQKIVLFRLHIDNELAFPALTRIHEIVKLNINIWVHAAHHKVSVISCSVQVCGSYVHKRGIILLRKEPGVNELRVEGSPKLLSLMDPFLCQLSS